MIFGSKYYWMKNFRLSSDVILRIRVAARSIRLPAVQPFSHHAQISRRRTEKITFRILRWRNHEILLLNWRQIICFDSITVTCGVTSRLEQGCHQRLPGGNIALMLRWVINKARNATDVFPAKQLRDICICFRRLPELLKILTFGKDGMKTSEAREFIGLLQQKFDHNHDGMFQYSGAFSQTLPLAQ